MGHDDDTRAWHEEAVDDLRAELEQARATIDYLLPRSDELAQVQQERDEWIDRCYCQQERADKAEMERDEALDALSANTDVPLLEKYAALLAENRVLREIAANPWERFTASDGELGMRQKVLPEIPLTTAEAARVAALEAVAEAAKEYRDRGDVGATELDAALTLWREGRGE